MAASFDVFIIGPMGNSKNDPHESKTPISQHMKNIKEALKIALVKFKKPGEFNIYSPTDNGNDIEGYVFSQIDSSELAVADISSRSPSVMYELAYFHALGTPVILIDDIDNRGSSIPFYLRGIIVARSKFDVPSLVESLTERLDIFFNGHKRQDFTTNPITKFYGAPLVEISGATTIARSYFRNLIAGFLNINSGVINDFPDDGISHLCVVRPTDDLQINANLKDFGDAIRKRLGPVAVARETSWDIRVAGRSRTISAHLVGNVAYDFPRTIGALSNSPRLSRLRKTPTLADIRSKIERALIDRFFDEIVSMTNNDDSLFSDKLEIITLDEFRQRMAATI